MYHNDNIKNNQHWIWLVCYGLWHKRIQLCIVLRYDFILLKKSFPHNNVISLFSLNEAYSIITWRTHEKGNSQRSYGVKKKKKKQMAYMMRFDISRLYLSEKMLNVVRQRSTIKMFMEKGHRLGATVLYSSGNRPLSRTSSIFIFMLRENFLISNVVIYVKCLNMNNSIPFSSFALFLNILSQLFSLKRTDHEFGISQ